MGPRHKTYLRSRPRLSLTRSPPTNDQDFTALATHRDPLRFREATICRRQLTKTITRHKDLDGSPGPCTYLTKTVGRPWHCDTGALSHRLQDKICSTPGARRSVTSSAIGMLMPKTDLRTQGGCPMMMIIMTLTKGLATCLRKTMAPLAYGNPGPHDLRLEPKVRFFFYEGSRGRIAS